MKGIIFDLDNTLVDFMRMKHASCNEAMSSMIDAGLKMDHEEGMKVLFELYDQHGIEYQKIFQEFLTKTLGHIDWKILACGIVAYRRVKTGFLEPYPHVHQTLLQLKLKNIKMGIVSDAPRLNAWLRLAAMKLTDFFDVVVTYDDTGEKKPSPVPFKRALEKMELEPRSVIMVGDWPERDMKGAHELGMKSCFARYGYHQKYDLQDSGADFVIDDIQQLLKLV